MSLLNYLFGEKEDNINNIETKIDNQLEKDTNINIQDEIAMGCSCQSCDGDVVCTNSVPFNCAIIVPSIFTLPTPKPGQDLSSFISIAWNDNRLECVMDNCELSATVTDPCNGGTIPGCTVCVKRFRYIGCIKFIACLSPIRGEGPSTPPGFGANSTACASGTCCVCVNQVICFTCDCNDMCPTTGNLVTGYTITSATQTPVCDNNVICVSGTFNFTTPTPCGTTSTPAVGCGCAQTAAPQK